MKLHSICCLLLLGVCIPALQDQSVAAPVQTPGPEVVRTNAALVPVPRPQDGPRKRFEELNRRVKEAAGNVDLVFLGDSITQGWEGKGKDVWQTFYAGRKALNLGIGGDRTQHVLWRLEQGNFDGLKPKVVVLMIGTNNSNRDDHSAEEILAGVTAIVRKLRALSPETRILLLGIFPRGKEFNDQRGKILQVNQALAKLDDGQRVFFEDFGFRLIELDGSISKAIMPDYLHLSEAGYQIWAESIEPRLAQWLGPRPVAAVDSVRVAGDWSWRMKGPNGEEVSGLLEIQVAGDSVTGAFRTEEGRVLKIRSGKLAGDTVRWTLVRDRPQGGEMVYEMDGKVIGNEIKGEAVTEFDGRQMRVPWSAVRK